MAQSPDTKPAALYHRDLGGSVLPALVILHGMLGSSRNWQTAGRDLAAHRRVVALDLRNHGQSPHAEPMTYAAMAADVLAWMDAEGLANAEILGHSMGGKVAMLLACRHPERVSGLVVVDVAPKAYHWRAHREEFAAMNELQLGDLRSRAEAEIRMEGRVPSWPMRKFLATNLERDPGGGFRWQVNLPVMTQALPVLEQDPLGPEDRFMGRVLFVTGGRSAYVEPGDHAAILARFPYARFVEIAASGHNPHIEARQSLVAAVAAELTAAPA